MDVLYRGINSHSLGGIRSCEIGILVVDGDVEVMHGHLVGASGADVAVELVVGLASDQLGPVGKCPVAEGPMRRHAAAGVDYRAVATFQVFVALRRGYVARIVMVPVQICLRGLPPQL